MKLIVLFLVVASALAVPVPVSERDSCSQQCTESAKFNYEAGKRYEFQYETSSVLELPGMSRDNTGLHITAVAQVNVISKCEMELKLRDVTLQDSKTGTKATSPSETEFKTALEQLPLHFSFQDGKVEHICRDSSETKESLNVKAAFLSAFQVSLDELERDSTIHESDVSGECLTNCRVEGTSWTGALTIRRSKDLTTCNNRTEDPTTLQGYPYNTHSHLKDVPLMKARQECEHTISNARLTEVECTETTMLRPFSYKEHGAKVKSIQKLRFLSASDSDHQSHGSQYHANHFQERTPLRFEHFDVTFGDNDLNAAYTALDDILASMQPNGDVRPETPALFSTFVIKLRRLSHADFATLKLKVERGRRFRDAPEMAKKFFQDALPVVYTRESIRVMVELMTSGTVLPGREPAFLTSLATISDPSEDMMKEAKPLLDLSPAKGLLGVSALVHNFCRHSRTTVSCAENARVGEIVARLEELLGPRCRSHNEENHKEIVMILKAIGNIGEVRSVEATLTRCVTEAQENDIRVAALDAFRRLPCEAARTEMMNVLRDREVDSEVRIGAYLAVMKCPTVERLHEIWALLDSEDVNQVASFMWTHLTNMAESACPMKQEVRRIVSDAMLVKRFDMDKLKFSRNIEKSVFFEALNLGADFESNLVWSQRSFIPRSASFNLTFDFFGKSINFVQFGARAQGLEALLKDGLFPETTQPARSRRDLSEDKFNTIGAQFTEERDPMRLAVFLRLFDNDVYYNQMDTFDPSTLAQKFNYLDWMQKLAAGTVEETVFTRTYKLLDTRFCVPTISGLPLQLDLEAVTTVNLKMGGKMDMRNMMTFPFNVEIDGHFEPSGAVQVSGTMMLGASGAKAGARMDTTLHTSTFIGGKFQLEDGKLAHFKLDAPRQKQELVSAKSKFFLLHQGQAIEQTGVVPQRASEEKCTPEKVSTILGAKLCFNAQVPDWTNDDTAYFPLAGPWEMNLFLEKTDSHTGYEVQLNYEKTRNKKEFNILIDTPGANTDRLISGSASLQGRDFKLGLQSPWKQFSTEGSWQNTQRKKKFEFVQKVDQNTVLDFKSVVLIASTPRKTVYTPTIEVTLPNKPTKKLTGEFTFNPDAKMQVEGKIENVFPQDLSFSGGYAKVQKVYNASLEVKSHLFDSEVNVQVDTSESAPSALFQFDYQLPNEAKRTYKFSTKLRNRSTQQLYKYIADMKGELSHFPELNFDVSAEHEHDKTHSDTTLKLNWGHDMTDAARSMELHHRYSFRELPRGVTGEHHTKMVIPKWNVDAATNVEFKQNRREMSGNADMKWGRKTYKGDVTVTKIQGTGYDTTFSTQWGPGKKFTGRVEYRPMPKGHKLNGRVRLLPYEPVTFNAEGQMTRRRSSVDMSVNYGSVELTKVASVVTFGNMQEASLTVDVQIPEGRKMKWESSGKMGDAKWEAKSDLCWDVDGDQDKRVAFEFTHDLEDTRNIHRHDASLKLTGWGKTAEFGGELQNDRKKRIKFDAVVDGTRGFLEAEYDFKPRTKKIFGLLKGMVPQMQMYGYGWEETHQMDFGLEGSLANGVESAVSGNVNGRQLELNFNFRPSNEWMKAHWDVVFALPDPLIKKAQYRMQMIGNYDMESLWKGQARVQFLTPIPTMRSIVWSYNHDFSSLDTPTAKMTSVTEGRKTEVEFMANKRTWWDLDSSLKLTVPGKVNGGLDVVYKITNKKIDVKFNAQKNPRTKGSVELVCNHDFHHHGSEMDMKLVVKTPFEKARRSELSYSHEQTTERLSGNTELKFWEHEAKVTFGGSMENEKYTVNVGLDTVCPNDIHTYKGSVEGSFHKMEGASGAVKWGFGEAAKEFTFTVNKPEKKIDFKYDNNNENVGYTTGLLEISRWTDNNFHAKAHLDFEKDDGYMLGLTSTFRGWRFLEAEVEGMANLFFGTIRGNTKLNHNYETPDQYSGSIEMSTDRHPTRKFTVVANTANPYSVRADYTHDGKTTTVSGSFDGEWNVFDAEMGIDLHEGFSEEMGLPFFLHSPKVRVSSRMENNRYQGSVKYFGNDTPKLGWSADIGMVAPYSTTIEFFSPWEMMKEMKWTSSFTGSLQDFSAEGKLIVRPHVDEIRTEITYNSESDVTGNIKVFTTYPGWETLETSLRHTKTGLTYKSVLEMTGPVQGYLPLKLKLDSEFMYNTWKDMEFKGMVNLPLLMPVNIVLRHSGDSRKFSCAASATLDGATFGVVVGFDRRDGIHFDTEVSTPINPAGYSLNFDYTETRRKMEATLTTQYAGIGECKLYGKHTKLNNNRGYKTEYGWTFPEGLAEWEWFNQVRDLKHESEFRGDTWWNFHTTSTLTLAGQTFGTEELTFNAEDLANVVVNYKRNWQNIETTLDFTHTGNLQQGVCTLKVVHDAQDIVDFMVNHDMPGRNFRLTCKVMDMHDLALEGSFTGTMMDFTLNSVGTYNTQSITVESTFNAPEDWSSMTFTGKLLTPFEDFERSRLSVSYNVQGRDVTYRFNYNTKQWAKFNAEGSYNTDTYALSETGDYKYGDVAGDWNYRQSGTWPNIMIEYKAEGRTMFRYQVTNKQNLELDVMTGYFLEDISKVQFRGTFTGRPSNFESTASLKFDDNEAFSSSFAYKFLRRKFSVDWTLSTSWEQCRNFNFKTETTLGQPLLIQASGEMGLNGQTGSFTYNHNFEDIIERGIGSFTWTVNTPFESYETNSWNYSVNKNGLNYDMTLVVGSAINYHTRCEGVPSDLRCTEELETAWFKRIYIQNHMKIEGEVYDYTFNGKYGQKEIQATTKVDMGTNKLVSVTLQTPWEQLRTMEVEVGASYPEPGHYIFKEMINWNDNRFKMESDITNQGEFMQSKNIVVSSVVRTSWEGYQRVNLDVNYSDKRKQMNLGYKLVKDAETMVEHTWAYKLMRGAHTLNFNCAVHNSNVDFLFKYTASSLEAKVTGNYMQTREVMFHTVTDASAYPGWTHKTDLQWEAGKSASFECTWADNSRRMAKKYTWTSKIVTPFRTMEKTIDFTANRRKTNLEFKIKPDVTRNPQREFTASFDLEKEDAGRKFEMSLNQQWTVRGMYYTPTRTSVFKMDAEFEYCTEADKKMTMTLDLQKPTETSFKGLWDMTHPVSNIDYHMEESYDWTNGFVWARTVRCKLASGEMHTCNFGFTFNPEDKTVAFLFDIPEAAGMSGKKIDIKMEWMHADNGYTVKMTNKYDDDKTVSTELSWNLGDKDFDFKLRYDPRDSQKLLHVSGQFVNETAVAFDAYHMHEGQRATDLNVRVFLTGPHMILSEFNWRPESYDEFFTYASERLQYVKTKTLDYFTRRSEWWSSNNQATMDLISNSISEKTGQLIDDLKAEKESFVQDLRRMKRKMTTAYENDEFFARTVYEKAEPWMTWCITKLSEPLISREMREKMMEMRERGVTMVKNMAMDAFDYCLHRMEVMREEFHSVFGVCAETFKACLETVPEYADMLKEKYNVFLEKAMRHIGEVREYVQQSETMQWVLEWVAKARQVHLDTTNRVTGVVDRYFGGLRSRANDFVSQVQQSQQMQHMQVVAQSMWAEARNLGESYGVGQGMESLVDKYVYGENGVAGWLEKAKESRILEWDLDTGKVSFQTFNPLHWDSFYTFPTVAKYIKALNTLVSMFPKSGSASTTSSANLMNWYYSYRLPTSAWDVLPPFKAIGMVSGDQHFYTFDGKFFEFAAPCNYILARDFVEEKFSVVVNFKTENGRAVRDSLTVMTDSKSVEIFQDGRVTLSGEQKELPLQSGDLVVMREGNTVTLALKDDLKVTCMTSERVCTVEVSGWHFGHIAGLLGTYNNELWDDFMTSERNVVRDVDTFARSWEVGRSCSAHENTARPSDVNHPVCQAMFNDWESPLASCFFLGKTAMFERMCRNDMGNSPTEKKACTSAAAFVQFCRFNGVHVRMPSQCVMCGDDLKEGESREISETMAPQHADVVFVVEERSCNSQAIGKMTDLADEIKDQMDAKGMTTHFGLAAFGGSGIHKPPHMHTIASNWLGEGRSFSLGVQSLVIADETEPSDALAAIEFASRFPFHTGSQRIMVLISCGLCEQRTWSYSEVKRALSNNGITLHVMRSHTFTVRNRTPQNSLVFGVDGSMVYSAKSLLGNRFSGDAALFNQLTMERDVCHALATGSSGTVWDTGRMTNPRQRIVKQFRNVAARRITQNAAPMECQVCNCVPDGFGGSRSECRSCQDPNYSGLLGYMMDWMPNWTGPNTNMGSVDPRAPGDSSNQIQERGVVRENFFAQQQQQQLEV